jgi:hypothetical protein
MDNTQTPRFCRVHDHITAQQFGCEPSYFDSLIKDQPLQVLHQVKDFLVIKTADGEEYTVQQDDVTQQPFYLNMGFMVAGVGEEAKA